MEIIRPLSVEDFERTERLMEEFLKDRVLYTSEDGRQMWLTKEEAAKVKRRERIEGLIFTFLILCIAVIVLFWRKLFPY